MENKIATSVEQSKKLLELGIDRNTSDMYYWCGEKLRIGRPKTQDNDYSIPAWSLTALVEMLPEGFLLMNKQGECTPILYWIPGFKGSHFWKHNLLDTAFEIICWLKENKNNGSDLKQNKWLKLIINDIKKN